MPPRAYARASLGLCTLAFLAVSVRAADWPTSRYDAGRTSASPQHLPVTLHLHWLRSLPALRPAWPDQPKVQMDAAYAPIVVGSTLYVASSRNDGVSAFDTHTGEFRWHFFVDGPVRFAPAYWEGSLYFSSDDGYLYCLDAQRGALRWKFRGGPSDRNILGNGRLISTWPARGAPVVQDGTVYFAASIWPFMGIFLHAVDARTGKVQWTTDGDGSLYTQQPHNTDSFAGVAPQGALVIDGDALLVPSGRSIPACYDRKTGKLMRYQLAENGKRGGGADVSALGNVFFNGGSAFEVATEHWLGDLGQPVALTDKTVFGLKDGSLVAHAFPEPGLREADGTSHWTMPVLATVPVPWAESLILAGDRLYVGGKDRVAAFDLPLRDNTEPCWEAAVEGRVARLVAADDRLFAVTRSETIYCFGAESVQVRRHPLAIAPPAPEDEWTRKAAAMLRTTGVREGHCVVWGAGSGRLVEELLRQSQLQLVVVEPDGRKVQALRERLAALNVYGERVSVHVGEPMSFPLPPYFASLMVSENLSPAGLLGPSFMARAFNSLRPYGGVACFSVSGVAQPEKLTLGLPRAAMRIDSGLLLISREGALPGSADWTHEHADAANTRVSRDQLVKAPLGVLWFGGPSHDGVLPRHGHGPQPQVIDGRLIIEGVDMVRAMDIYTGRFLWETPLPGVGAFYDNVAHQPGANASGTNFISTSDGIYVVYNERCVRLDPATGRQIGEFHLPPLPGKTESPRWGYINVAGNLLIGGADPLYDEQLAKAVAQLATDGHDEKNPEKASKQVRALTAIRNLHLAEDLLSASRYLVVMDRHTGKVLWSVSAHSGFRHNATCAGGGRLYTIDRMSGLQLAALKGHVADAIKPRLRVFDLPTGKELWSVETDIFGTWLSYSAKHDVLVEAGRVARDTMSDEPSGMRAYHAADGKVLWHNADYTGPAILHGDTVLWERAGCDLLTGKRATRKDPITGETVDWTWTRNYGCNTPMASEHLLTFRSGAAGYFDLCNDGGTGNFGGFRSSCTNNLVVAGGVLTVPDYTRTCTCNYQNQTSLAMVPMAEAEMWTSFGTSMVKGAVRRVGINLGAPGDRKAADGTLWLEYPSIGGTSPAVPVSVLGDKLTYFRRHSSQVKGEMNWVVSSGVKGVSSVTVGLDADGKGGERTFTVRLLFAEPDELKVGQRVFGVSLQGKEVLHDFDVVHEAGGALKAVVKEFKKVRAGRELAVTFAPASGSGLPAILCGLEVSEEP